MADKLTEAPAVEPEVVEIAEEPAVEAVVEVPVDATFKHSMNDEVHNPRLLLFPQDTAGFLYDFKHTTLQTIERMNGNPEKYSAFMETLQVLGKFAKRRYKLQCDDRAQLAEKGTE